MGIRCTVQKTLTPAYFVPLKPCSDPSPPPSKGKRKLAPSDWDYLHRIPTNDRTEEPEELSEAPPSPILMHFLDPFACPTDNYSSSSGTWTSDCSPFSSEADPPQPPDLFPLSPSALAYPLSLNDTCRIPDSDREGYSPSPEKLLECDAYAGPVLYTVQDWQLFTELAPIFAFFPPRDRGRRGD